MNKLRVLNNNIIQHSNVTIIGEIYEYQRLFHGTVTGTFSIGETVTGGTSGLSTGVIEFVGADFIDIALVDDVNFYLPNNTNPATETITTAGGSATTTGGYRIPIYHPDFPQSNFTNTNRNTIVPAKGYEQLNERNFKKHKTTITNNGIERQMILTTASALFIVGETITDDSDSTISGIVTQVTGTAPNITLQYYLTGTSANEFDGTTGSFTGDISGATATAVNATNIIVTREAVSCIAIVNHNLTNTATIELHIIDETDTEVYNPIITNPNVVQFNADNNYALVNGQNYLIESDRKGKFKNNNIWLLYLPAEYNIATIELDIVDTNNTDSYIYVGNIYAGTYYEVETNMQFGWQIAPTDLSNTLYALSPYSVERPMYNTLQLSFANVKSNERSYWNDLFYRNGIHTDFIINLFNDSLDYNDAFFTFYGRFATNSLPFSNDYQDRFSTQLSFRESI